MLGGARAAVVGPGLRRSSLSRDETVWLDPYYVDNWSMLTDLAIMSKTVKAVLRSEGA
jgi:lipopolysaccharide/colanic/teichoic acid biosynthesis glycosyltransferase